MKLSCLEEPALEFGAGRHIDIRFGVMNYGPLDFESGLAPKQINLGIIGSVESADGARQWLMRCQTPIASKPNKEAAEKATKHPHLFAAFPGFSSHSGFQSVLMMEDGLCRTISKNAIMGISNIRDRNERVVRSVDLFMEEIRYLAQETQAQVIICAIPLPLLAAIGAEDTDSEDEESDVEGVDDAIAPLDFHDMLKAGAMQQYRKPIQLILPGTYDTTKQAQQAKLGFGRADQDEATKAWNIHTALYYKAGGVPWRLPRESSELAACYVGVSFYRSLDKQALLTSVAQVFNERGEGVVVRGGHALVSKEDRQPHLPKEQAYNLLRQALDAYRRTHQHYPARVVIHKSSRFDENEKLGFETALKECSIATHDLLSISNSNTRLYRAGRYPPLRGSLLTLDEKEMVLYTRGSIPFFETYPGQYIPNPIRIRSESTEQTQQYLAGEILALTKMNWNNTQFDGAEPVTLRASRQCSSVLRYCSEGRQIEPRYSFYM